jgi:hypothetical protein
VSLIVAFTFANTLLISATHPLSAANGELRFTPATPRAGQTIALTYRPTTRLAGDDRVRVRARYRTIHDNLYSEPPFTEGTDVVTIATLRRRADGTFAGSFHFPDSVVYAVFAVENEDATFVDANHGQYWELLAHDARHRPLFDALDQRIADLLGRNWVEAFATARRMVAVYPDRPASWTTQWMFENLLTGDDKKDSLFAAYRDRFTALARRFDGDAAAARRELPEMAYFALRVEVASGSASDSALARPWIARAKREAPTSPAVLDVRASQPARGMRRDPVRSVAEYDALWQEGGDSLYRASRGFQPRHQMSRGAYRAALLAKDTAAFLRWSGRVAQGGRYARRKMARVATEQPFGRALAMDWIRDELRVAGELRPEHRFLAETAVEQRKRQAQESRELLALLGKTLVAEGGSHARAALDTLVLAAADGWNLAVFRDIADARLSASDTVGALDMLAKIVVDPRTTSAEADSMRQLAQRTVGAARWTAMVGGARAEMPRRVLVTSVDLPVDGPVRLTDRSGNTRKMSELAVGKPAFVFHWVHDCPDAMKELSFADSVGARLAAVGVRVFSVTGDSPSPAIDSLIRQKKLVMPVYYDLKKDVGRAFNTWGWPAYLVVDAAGRLRFRSGGGSPDDALVQVAALQQAALQP